MRERRSPETCWTGACKAFLRGTTLGMNVIRKGSKRMSKDNSKIEFKADASMAGSTLLVLGRLSANAPLRRFRLRASWCKAGKSSSRGKGKGKQDGEDGGEDDEDMAIVL